MALFVLISARRGVFAFSLATPRGTASEFARRMFRKVDDQQQS
jgi:hypothetical protein